jgi:GAF domain-containing protein
MAPMGDAERGSRLDAAAAAGLLPAEPAQRELLQSIVAVARAVFGAKAASIQRHDEQTGELVFEAVAGEGADTLVGQRYDSGRGIGGWVLASAQPLVIEDVTKDPRFARDFAESTGFVPKGLMSAPLLAAERLLGVMQVLDRPAGARSSLDELELLALFANQAAAALEAVERVRRVRALVDGGEAEVAAGARVAAALDALEEPRRGAGVNLLRALEDVLKKR